MKILRTVWKTAVQFFEIGKYLVIVWKNVKTIIAINNVILYIASKEIIIVLAVSSQIFADRISILYTVITAVNRNIYTMGLQTTTARIHSV